MTNSAAIGDHQKSKKRVVTQLMRGVLALSATVGLSGCIGAAGIPGGPLQGTGVSLGSSWGEAFAPSRITMRSTTNARRYRYDDNAGDSVNFPAIPSRLGARVGITKWFDAAGDVSYLDSGFELRGGLPEGARPFPMALSLGLRSGRLGLMDLDNRGSHEERLRWEGYPRLGTFEYWRVNLISTLGVSIGKRFHPLLPPNSLSAPSLDGFGPTIDPRVLRDETRLEGSVGGEVRRQNFFASAVLMPYVVASSGSPSSVCDSCEGFEVQSFRSNFGAALFVTFGVSFPAADSK